VRRQSAATILVGSNALQREGLARILHAAGFQIVASGAILDTFQVDSLAKHQAILLIVDSSDDSGVAVGIIEQFKAHHPTGRVAVIGERARSTDIVSVFRSGANVYLVNDVTCGAFIKQLELVMRDETILPRELLPFVESHEVGRVATQPPVA
jgi:two-component system nitrate/nitrite response regulator NarL